jgi:hypothetical protein
MKITIALATACAIGLVLAPGAIGGPAGQQVACGPKISVLLWPKGYKAYPLPNFEMFRGWSGPYGTSNLLAYAAAAKEGTLGFPAASVGPDCLNYDGAGKLTPGPMNATAKTPVRLACRFPKAVTVQIDDLAHYTKRVRVAIAPGTVVADATVTTHGSSLKYVKQYCTRKLPLIEPTS